MKTRDSLVSNSSSTSFVFAFSSVGQRCPHCGRRDPDLVDIIGKHASYCSCDNEVLSTDIDEILTLFNEDYNWSAADKEAQIFIKKLEEAKEKHPDWSFVYCEISYHDEELREHIGAMKDNGSLIEIFRNN